MHIQDLPCCSLGQWSANVWSYIFCHSHCTCNTKARERSWANCLPSWSKGITNFPGLHWQVAYWRFMSINRNNVLWVSPQNTHYRFKHYILGALFACIFLYSRRCKTSSVGQSARLSIIPRSSVRFWQKLNKPRTRIYMDLSYIDPQARVLNYCFKK